MPMYSPLDLYLFVSLKYNRSVKVPGSGCPVVPLGAAVPALSNSQEHQYQSRPYRIARQYSTFTNHILLLFTLTIDTCPSHLAAGCSHRQAPIPDILQFSSKLFKSLPKDDLSATPQLHHLSKTLHHDYFILYNTLNFILLQNIHHIPCKPQIMRKLREIHAKKLY